MPGPRTQPRRAPTLVGYWFSRTVSQKSRSALHEFIAKHEDQITGTLSGFDRLVFRGTLRPIAPAGGMKQYLWANQILLKDCGAHGERVSREIQEASLAEAVSLGRPVQYLSSSFGTREK